MIDESHLRKTYNGLNSINLSMPLYGTATTINDGSWNHFNQLIDEAAKYTDDKQFLTYRIESSSVGNSGRHFVRINEYAPKVHAAARYFYDQYHELYFDEDTQPPALDRNNTTSPSSQVINNNQSQENRQSQLTEINFEFKQTFQYVTEQLIRSEDNYEEGTSEKSFINKLKGAIATARSTADIIKLIVLLAAETGIAAESLKNIFS